MIKHGFGAVLLLVFMSSAYAQSPSADLCMYVGNDPANNTDPSGKMCDGVGPCDGSEVKGSVAIGNAIGDAIAHHPGETMQVVGTGISMIPAPQAKAAGGAIGEAGTITRALDGENTANPPSTLTPGPNAGGSVPASGPKITPGEQPQVNKIGDAAGCHTCGATTPGTKSGNWVGDHQPPNKLNPSGGSQRLYPQCLSCSRRQGGEVNKAVQQIQNSPENKDDEQP